MKLKENASFRNEIVCYLKSEYSLSVRQIEKVTGLNRGMILQVLQEDNVSARTVLLDTHQ